MVRKHVPTRISAIETSPAVETDNGDGDGHVGHSASPGQKHYHWDIVWKNVILIMAVHVMGLYGFYLKFFYVPKWQSFTFNMINLLFHGIGVTGGRHRLWAHRSYKAHFAVELFLAAMAASVYEQSIYIWVRDHRLHHKHSDTDADPYNSRRGFFFCHIGWFFVRKHKEVLAKGKTIDMSDLESNPIVMFEHKHNKFLSLIFTIMIPTLVPWYFWGEDWKISFFYCCLWRLILILHITWSVNSVAHLYGYRPYDKSIQPVENTLLSMFSGGEGFHNYHHAFPFDYKAAELGSDMRNITTILLDYLASYGLVYDRKTVSEEVVKQRIQRTGDADLLQGKRNFYNSLVFACYILIFV